jgi:hypothetical protein
VSRDSERVARLLDQIRSRVGRLERSVAHDESIPNILGVTEDRADGTETTSTTVGDAGAARYDQDAYDNAKYQ